MTDEPYERRWLALAVIAVTVLMVILDATIVNIALPSVSKDLKITPATQQWIVTAYTLTFVGLLLGGVLTEYADWRWCFWVNVPVAIVAVAAALPIVPESKAPGDTAYDVPGA